MSAAGAPGPGRAHTAGDPASRPGHHEHAPLPALRRRLLVAGIVLFLLGVALTVVVATSDVLQPLDDRFLDLMVSLRTPAAVDVGKTLSVAFGTAVLLPVRIVVTLVLAARRHWAALGAWLATLLSSELLIGPLKALLDRPRPPGPLIATSGASYPSGHAIASAVTAIGVVMALTSGRRRLHWMVVAVGLAALVSLSRTYLSAHWLTDVAGGSLLGAGLALAIPEGVEVWRDRRLSRRRPGPRSTAAS
jgi:membrane-associated phospholipid phosphatase